MVFFLQVGRNSKTTQTTKCKIEADSCAPGETNTAKPYDTECLRCHGAVLLLSLLFFQVLLYACLVFMLQAP